jgi:FAD/FMN-containing dehydrogenase
MTSCCAVPLEKEEVNLDKLETFALPGVAEHPVSQLKGYAPYGSTEYTTAKLGGWTDEQLNPQPVSGADPVSNNRNFPVKPETWGKGKLESDPCCIVTCFDGKDVATALDYYKKSLFKNGDLKFDCRLAVACGRHSDMFWEEGAFVIDVTGMNSVTVNMPTKDTVTFGAGCVAGNVLNAIKQFNIDSLEADSKFIYTIASGNAYTVGVSGICLTGGAGYLYRSRGLMCDSVVSYELVSLDGSTKTVTESENKDLFIALKGGGGNFGVVTQFELKLIKIPRNVFVSQRVMFPLGTFGAPTRATLLDKHVDFFKTADFGVSSYFVVFASGPCIELALNSKFDHTSTESPNACATLSDAIKEYATKTNPNWAKIPPATILDNMDYYKFMEAGIVAPAGAYHSFDSIISDFSETVKGIICKYTDGTVKGHSDSHVIIYCLAPPPKKNVEDELRREDAASLGYTNNSTKETRSGLRDAEFMVIVLGHETDKAWVDSFFGELRPHVTAHYAPHLPPPGVSAADFERLLHGKNLAALKEVKRVHDPQNMLQMNTNIVP